MTTLPYYEVNSFTDKPFQGNPAGVCLLTEWLGDAALQALAAQNNLSETAFVVPKKSDFEIRWFTPASEINLCGHATLAAAHVVSSQRPSSASPLRFLYKEGVLEVTPRNGKYDMLFPAWGGTPFNDTAAIAEAIGVPIKEAHLARELMVVLESESAVTQFTPNFDKVRELPGLGLIITATGHASDFVSRSFFPKVGIPEDPVTGAAHCMLAPYWAEQLGKQTLYAKQLSARGGEIWCRVDGDKVVLTGAAVTYLKGEVFFGE